MAAGVLADLVPDASTAEADGADITVRPFQSTVVRSCADPVPFEDCPPDRIREWAPPASTAVSCIDLADATEPVAVDEATWHVSGEVGAFLTAAVLTYESADETDKADEAAKVAEVDEVDEAVERARAAPDECPPEPGRSGADLETWVETSSGPLHVVFGPRRVSPDTPDTPDTPENRPVGADVDVFRNAWVVPGEGAVAVVTFEQQLSSFTLARAPIDGFVRSVVSDVAELVGGPEPGEVEIQLPRPFAFYPRPSDVLRAGFEPEDVDIGRRFRSVGVPVACHGTVAFPQGMAPGAAVEIEETLSAKQAYGAYPSPEEAAQAFAALTAGEPSCRSRHELIEAPAGTDALLAGDPLRRATVVFRVDDYIGQITMNVLSGPGGAASPAPVDPTLTMRWASVVLERAGLPSDWLPATGEAGDHLCSRIPDAARAILGIADTPGQPFGDPASTCAWRTARGIVVQMQLDGSTTADPGAGRITREADNGAVMSVTADQFVMAVTGGTLIVQARLPDTQLFDAGEAFAAHFGCDEACQARGSG